MTLTTITNAVTGSLHKFGFVLRKHSPEILAVGGTIGVIASGILACKATTKVGAILEETKDTLDIIHEGTETGEVCGKEYTAEDGKKDTAIVYAQTGWKLVKLYGPSVGLGILSIGALLTSNNILRRRNLALATAYAALDKGFKSYRSNVLERFGKKVDHELLYNIKAKQITEEVVDEETGEVKQVEKTVEVVDASKIFPDPYCRFFDEYNENWEKNPEFNMMFLRARQSWANDLLKSKRHLFLNEVYEMLGLPKSKAGQFVGWIYDPKNPDHKGDNYVDFGIFEAKRQNMNFVNGYEPSILLTFNVDGDIVNKMETIEYGDKFTNN